MVKKLTILTILFLLLNFPASANENNKFGIHLAQPHLEDIDASADLVNAQGGDWGYVTLVIQEDDRNKSKWQEIFERLRKRHLIPIIRLATKPEGNYWKRPVAEEGENWANFLDSLNWVVEDRYIILFNEPNHAGEWGGAVDADSYQEIAFTYAKILKEKNSHFFVMLAGLDASAPSALPNYEDENTFLKKILEETGKVDFEKYIDGWSSHSYPNPAFAGSPTAYGRGTVRTYQWELSFLKEWGIDKDLPVFITETGWSDKKLSRTTIANYFRLAFETVWLPDERVVAVTPFVFNYQGEPFIDFSWKRLTDSPLVNASEKQDFYPQYYQVQAMDKTKGEPSIIEAGKIIFEAPKELVANSSYDFKLKIKNAGQAIWDKDNGYFLSLEGFPKEKYFFSDLKNIKPFEETEVDLYLKTNGTLGPNQGKIILYQNDKEVLESGDWKFNISPLPSLEFRVSAYPKLQTEGDDFEIQIFDEGQNLILKRSGLRVRKGIGYLDDIQNILLGKKYRVVILRPYYLPRQAVITLQSKDNQIKFERMLPLDFNADGKLSLNDFSAFTKNWRLLKMFFP